MRTEVPRQFSDNFALAMKHMGADQDEINQMKQDIREEKFPLKQYEDWVNKYVERHNLGRKNE